MTHKKTIIKIMLVLIAIIAICAFGETSKVFAEPGDPIISIGDETYTEFLDALIARKSDDTLVLLDDVTDNRYFGIGNGKDLTIDLNNHDLYIGGLQINGANVTITGKGTVYVSISQPFNLIGSTEEVDNYTTLTIDKDVTLHSTYTSGWYYMIVHNGAAPYNDSYGIKVNFNGKIEGESNGVGLYVSGNYQSTEDVITIGSSAVINTTEGIYAAGDATWNFEGTINSEATGIEIRAGKLNITGGKITATYIPTVIQANGNGGTTDGAAIAIAQHTTKLPIDVKVSGGIFTAFTPFNQSNPQGNAQEYIDTVKVSITGGTFNTLETAENEPTPTNVVYSENFTKFITGGEFSIYPHEKYLADGYETYEPMEEGKVVVCPHETITINKETIVLNVGESADIDYSLSNNTMKKYVAFAKMNDTIFNDLYGDYNGVVDASAIVLEGEKITAVKPGAACIGVGFGDYWSTILVVVVDVRAEDTASKEDKEVSNIVANVILDAMESEDEVTDALGLTEEEMEAVGEALNSGKQITIDVLIDAKKEPTKDETAKIEEKLPEGAKVAGYYDISVLIKADGEEIAKIRDLGKKIELSVILTEEETKVEEGYTRTYSIIRIHDGKAEVVATGLTAVNGKLSFETDKFSTYAIAYEDTAKKEETKVEEAKTEEAKAEETKTEETSKAANPKTGDNIIFAIIILTITVSGIAFIAKPKKIKK